MIHAALFDMDGTLFDTEKIYRECWERAAKDVCPEVDILQDLPRISGMVHASIARYFYEKYGSDFPYEKISALRLTYTDARLADGIPCKPGVPEIFDALRRLRIKTAVVSSTGKNRIRRYLVSAGIADCFDGIVGGDDVANGKPAPDPFLAGAALLGVAPQECVVLEDSANGVASGNAAGMKVIMVPDLHPCTPELRKKLWHCAKTLEPVPALIAAENA